MPENNDTLIKILETLQALQYQQNIESLSIEDIVQKYKFGHNKVYQMFQDSRLKKYKEGKKYLVLKSDFE
ncbi:MAG: hypothetical protein ACTTGJ_02190, partial [Clostridium sp.]